MRPSRSLILILSFVLCVQLDAADRAREISGRRLPATLGKGIGVVFSPDLAPRGNKVFYESLGFTYFEGSDWQKIFDQVARKRTIHTLVLETHGTNGNGLKVQVGKHPEDRRSYVSIGALQQKLEPSTVRTVLLSACNSGRLFRPEIYNVLNREPGDPLFLPATDGIYDAPEDFDGAISPVRVLRRYESNLETLIHGNYDELPLHAVPAVKRTGTEFAISSMMIQLLLGDPRLRFTEGGFVREKSREDYSKIENERLFNDFLMFLGGLHPPMRTASTGARAAGAP